MRVGQTVGESVENLPVARRLSLRLLGPVTLRRDSALVPLPRSRKVRALLAFLALSPAPVGRSRLTELLWDVPNDPRGELRWCLSKIRGILGESGRVVASDGDRVALDLSDCDVDAVEVDRATERGLSEAGHDELVRISDLFGGELLEGLVLDASPEFGGWLNAQRQRYRTLHIAVLQELVRRSAPGSDETIVRLQAWLQIAPFDARAHELLLNALANSGRLRNADEHLATTIRSFEQEGLDWAPLRTIWHAARANAARPPVTVLSAEKTPPTPLVRPRRASIAVMPFSDASPGGVGDGLTEDIITRLAKLRVLFVIARGTVFALRDRNVGPDESGRILDVEYVVSGRVRRSDQQLSVVVELAETRTSSIVWTDELRTASDGSAPVLDEVVDRIVAAIAEEIESAECKHAVLKAPSSLDAWEAYHRGLWHMYKFTGPDNREAARYFHAALELDTTFSRAYAGLSFTHFQNAFLDLTADRAQQIDAALETAGQSLSADDRDPAAHWAMGRALWLRGGIAAQQESLAELQRSIDLSPNFALGHYTLGFVHSQSGDPRSAIDATNHSRELSPFDPLQFAMLASRAMAHVRLGEFDEAAAWAVRATARPNAHAHILAIATECLALANRRDEARDFASRIRSRLPKYTVDDFLRAFRFAPDAEKLFRTGASRIGFD